MYPNTKWVSSGVTIAGGHSSGIASDQLNLPQGIYVDEKQTIFIADSGNNRIVGWKHNAKNGEVVAGGNGGGNRSDQLHWPLDVVIRRDTDSLLICDHWNQRVMQWPRHASGTTMHREGETVINNIACYGLAMDDQSYLYITDVINHKVSRYAMEEKKGTVVAGGHEQGNGLHQLNSPSFLFVDEEYSVYVSDAANHRVMKWQKGAVVGIVVADGQGQGTGPAQLAFPHGVWVDGQDTIFVADTRNDRVMRWRNAAEEGTMILGENQAGDKACQRCSPGGLIFNRNGDLCVVMSHNHRVQRFPVEKK